MIDERLLDRYHPTTTVNLSAAIPGRSLAADEATRIRGRQERFACATRRQHEWDPVNDTATLLIVLWVVAELSNKRCFFYTRKGNSKMNTAGSVS